MNHRNIELTSTLSLIFAPLLLAAYLYFMGMVKPIAQIGGGINAVLTDYFLAFETIAPIGSIVISAIFIVVGAMLNVMLTTRYNLFGTDSQFPLLLYVCFVVGFSLSSDILSASIASCIGVFSLRDFFRCYDNNKRISKFFTACFWMGILPMFYPSTIILWLAPFVFLMLFTMSFREVVVAICGLLLPITIYIYVNWLLGVEIATQIGEFMHSLVSDFSHPSLSWDSPLVYSLYLAGVISFLTLISLMQINVMSIRFVARTRLYCALILAALGGAMILLPSFSLDSLVTLAAPLSIVITPALVRMRGMITLILLFAIFILSSSFVFPFFVGI